jgi:CBS domain-containing protein
MIVFLIFLLFDKCAVTFPKVMTASPGCATLETSILEALQSMQDGKIRHIPVADKSKY